MWTDINTKPKQGAVFLAIRGHVMGIPADYNDASFATKCNFRPPSWVSKPVSMLSIPRDQVAAQECVGERVTNKGVEIWDQNPTKDIRVQFAVDKEVHPTAEPIKHDVPPRAPIKMASGRAWSPGIYKALRLLGKSLDVAWERAFIHPLTFN
jgi:hypothetical protein